MLRLCGQCVLSKAFLQRGFMKKIFYGVLLLMLGLSACNNPNPAPIVLASITITPFTASVAVGATTTLTATAKDSSGKPLATQPVMTWNSSDPAVATVANGVVTGVTTGSSSITAKSGAITGTVSVIVGSTTTQIPAWRTAMSAWQWVELPLAHLAVIGPAITPGLSLGGGYRSARIDAWNGMTSLGTSIYMAGVGGHADYAGNEGYQCDLAQSAPQWVMLSEPTPDSEVTLNTTHYKDGRPTSSHTYYSLFTDSLRNKVFRFGIGSGYGDGNFNRPTVDAFDLTKNDWDAANTWASVPESIGLGKAQTQHPITGDVYVLGDTKLWRFNRSNATWTQLAEIPQNGTAGYYRASMVDTTRNRLVILGDRYKTPTGILIYDMANNTWSNDQTLKGSYAAQTAAETGNVGYYNAETDTYLVKTSEAGQVLEVEPDTLTTKLVATTGGDGVPNAANGVFGKFVAVPALGGYAYQPTGNARMWFLASK
jgi:hypothetical protein